MSRIVILGNTLPYGLLLTGFIEDGPVLPWQPPKTFMHTTKKSSVSIAFPGPTISSHHPLVGCDALLSPETWESPVRAWQMSTAFVESELSFPHVSYAWITSVSTPPASSAKGRPSVTFMNFRWPTGSPGNHAPDTGRSREKLLG